MEINPEIEAKTTFLGNGAAFLIPRALFKTNVLQVGKRYKIKVIEEVVNKEGFLYMLRFFSPRSLPQDL